MGIILKLFSKFSNHTKHVFWTSVNFYILLDQTFTVTDLLKETRGWGIIITHLLCKIYYITRVLDSEGVTFTEVSKKLHIGRRERSVRKAKVLCGSLEFSRLHEDEENEAAMHPGFDASLWCLESNLNIAAL